MLVCRLGDRLPATDLEFSAKTKTKRIGTERPSAGGVPGLLGC
jgi:hypothetical protein